MTKRVALLAAVLLAGTFLSACGNDDDGSPAADSPTPAASSAAPATPTKLAINAKEYAFEVPTTITGGLFDVTYTNAGKEPHFAGFLKAAPGKTFADVKAALLSPPPGTPGAPPAPPGPPPFEEYAGMATASPGASGSATIPLAPGSYALFCALPAPDGAPHFLKGMLQEVTVTAGETTTLPVASTTYNATDFALGGGTAPTAAGPVTVGLRNDGKQAHEINLVELNAGKKIEDVVAFFTKESGPPPFVFRTGPFVKPGEQATGVFDLKAGTSYAFVCVIPDQAGDGAPHITKGMFTPAFQVT